MNRKAQKLFNLDQDSNDLYRAIADVASIKGDGRTVHCPRQIIIDESGLSVSAYKRCAINLEAAGLLKRSTEWSDADCRHNNVYTLLLEKSHEAAVREILEIAEQKFSKEICRKLSDILCPKKAKKKRIGRVISLKTCIV